LDSGRIILCSAEPEKYPILKNITQKWLAIHGLRTEKALKVIDEQQVQVMMCGRGAQYVMVFIFERTVAAGTTRGVT
jgi:hypothetical protein